MYTKAFPLTPETNTSTYNRAYEMDLGRATG